MRDSGVSACAVDLPGAGFDSDVAEVRATLDEIDGEVVLLGHSYGGAVVTDTGAQPSARHLVYLRVRNRRERVLWQRGFGGTRRGFDLPRGSPQPRCRDGAPRRRDVDSHVGRRTRLPLRGRRRRHVRLGVRAAPSTARRLPVATPQEIVWRTKPSTYVVCAEDQGVHPDLQRIMARRCTETVEWQLGHSPFANRPDWSPTCSSNSPAERAEPGHAVVVLAVIALLLGIFGRGARGAKNRPSSVDRPVPRTSIGVTSPLSAVTARPVASGTEDSVQPRARFRISGAGRAASSRRLPRWVGSIDDHRRRDPCRHRTSRRLRRTTDDGEPCERAARQDDRARTVGVPIVP